MNKITISFSVLLIFLYISGNSQKPNTNYISLEYSYDHTEQPIPLIIFYTESFITDEMFFVGSKFKIKKQDFASIERIAKTKSSYLIIDSSASRYYDIIVVKDEKKTIYGTVNLTKTKQIFDEICNELKKSENYNEINSSIQQLYKYLKPRGSITGAVK